MALLIACPVCASAVAEEEVDLSAMSLKELMSLEVFTSASLLPTQINRAPGTVYTFDRSDFARFGVRRLDDLLAFVPGLQLNQYRKRHRSIWSRGMIDRYNDKMVLMVDGARIRHLYYGHFSLGDNLPLEAIERVEVILGPASSLYGANALSGIVSITTREFSSSDSLGATLETANNDRGKGTLLYNSERLQAFGSYLQQDAPFREGRKSFIGGDTVQPLDEEFGNLLVKGSPIDGLTLSMNYAREETPFLFIPDTQDAYVDAESLVLSANYERGSVETGRIESTFYYHLDNAREYEIENTGDTLGYEEYQDAWMAGGKVTGFKRLDRHVLAAGVSWEHESAENTRYQRNYHFAAGYLTPPETGDLLSSPGISNDDYAFYLQDVWSLAPELDLTLGARYDKFEEFGGHWNQRAALVYTPESSQTWKLQYGSAIRTPTLREYLKVLEGTSFVPPPLEPEEIEQIELGYLYQWDNANLSLNLYRSELTNFIIEMPTPDDADEYFANTDVKVQLNGMEALLNAKPSEHLNLRAGLAYLERVDGDQAIPYVSSWTGSLQMDYRFRPSHTLGFSLIYNQARDDWNGFSEDDEGSFYIANLYGFGYLAPDWSYAYGIDNLFDRRVYDPAADFGNKYSNERSEREIWLRLTWDMTL
ncbi:TonB-dependent receptor [Marinobacterium sp. D7]|uniref:TonB-dependent receptor plug domain-containing protein n=1 Tax=Marinobacterium ramblicola TaxID=2849041 RepID=UPI001C2CE061|nr:TonB-dependent receptor [Marinobacterium ramblicola]MBV1787806.1 TonB-dependent receptor [Marinobacterium ramblicola]